MNQLPEKATFSSRRAYVVPSILDECSFAKTHGLQRGRCNETIYQKWNYTRVSKSNGRLSERFTLVSSGEEGERKKKNRGRGGKWLEWVREWIRSIPSLVFRYRILAFLPLRFLQIVVPFLAGRTREGLVEEAKEKCLWYSSIACIGFSIWLNWFCGCEFIIKYPIITMTNLVLIFFDTRQLHTAENVEWASQHLVLLSILLWFAIFLRENM